MQNGIQSITALGDSILKGVVSHRTDRIFDVIENDSLTLAARALSFSLTNKSLYGNVITKNLKLTEKLLSKNTLPDAVIVESGTNDSDYDWHKVSAHPDEAHTQLVPLPLFLKTFRTIIEKLRAKKITPIMMTMLPLDTERWFKEITDGKNESAIRSFLENDIQKLYYNNEVYSIALLQFARAHNVQMIDMRSLFLAQNHLRAFFCPDGIHPNEKGYELMAGKWIAELPKLKKEL